MLKTKIFIHYGMIRLSVMSVSKLNEGSCFSVLTVLGETSLLFQVWCVKYRKIEFLGQEIQRFRLHETLSKDSKAAVFPSNCYGKLGMGAFLKKDRGKSSWLEESFLVSVWKNGRTKMHNPIEWGTTNARNGSLSAPKLLLLDRPSGWLYLYPEILISSRYQNKDNSSWSSKIMGSCLVVMFWKQENRSFRNRKELLASEEVARPTLVDKDF